MDLTVMAQDAIKGLECEIAAPALSFYFLQESYALEIMLKGPNARLLTQFREVGFPIVAKGAMADIVAQGNSLYQVFV
jgi:hypothetical protein